MLQVLRCSWSYFICSRHLPNFAAIFRGTSKCEIAATKTGEGNYFILLFVLGNQNILSMQQWKFLKYMYPKCLNFACFLDYLPAHIKAAYKNSIKRSLEQNPLSFPIESHSNSREALLVNLRRSSANNITIRENGQKIELSRNKTRKKCRRNQQLETWLGFPS